MKGALLALSAVGSVAAQHITFPAYANVVAAIDPADPEYTVCSAANELLEACVASAGGPEGIETVDPDALLNCACCYEATPVSEFYSVCSTYLRSEVPLSTSDYSAYGDLYSICAVNADCGGGGGGGVLTTPRTTPPSTATPTPTRSSPITSPAEQTYATACVDMIGIFTSCTNKISDFTDLPFKEQAECYCCRRNMNGESTWTDALDQYASTCAQWARTGEPDTAYSVAQTFETFCENFSNACQATGTSDEPTITTPAGGNGGNGNGNGGNGGNGGQVTVTVTPDAAANVRVAVGAVAGAVGAFFWAL